MLRGKQVGKERARQLVTFWITSEDLISRAGNRTEDAIAGAANNSFCVCAGKAGRMLAKELELRYVDRSISAAKTVYLCGDVPVDSDSRDAGGVHHAHRYFPEYRYPDRCGRLF